MLETLDHTIRIGSTPTFLYFDLYVYRRADVYADVCRCFSWTAELRAGRTSAFETHAQDLRRAISYPEPAFEIKLGCTLVAWSAGVNKLIQDGSTRRRIALWWCAELFTLLRTTTMQPAWQNFKNCPTAQIRLVRLLPCSLASRRLRYGGKVYKFVERCRLISIRDWIYSASIIWAPPEIEAHFYPLICNCDAIFGWSHHEEWVAIFYCCEFIVFTYNHEIDEESKSILLNIRKL